VGDFLSFFWLSKNARVLRVLVSCREIHCRFFHLVIFVVIGTRGKVPALVRELIKDTRKMMSPFTALKLKERKSNRYLIFTGDVHVSLPMLVCVQGKGSLDFVRGCYVHQNIYLS